MPGYTGRPSYLKVDARAAARAPRNNSSPLELLKEPGRFRLTMLKHPVSQSSLDLGKWPLFGDGWY